MSKASRMTSAALTLAVWLGAGASFATEENWDATLMKPTQAKSLDVGSKRVISYFVSADGACHMAVSASNAEMVLRVAQAFDCVFSGQELADDQISIELTRVNSDS